jgi:sirohydrochlorin ferrochelatase
LSTAYLLVAHGSRDPRPKIALDRLTYLVAQHITTGSLVAQKKREIYQDKENHLDIPSSVLTRKDADNPLVFSASLEAQELALHRQLVNLGRMLIERGIKKLKILPLFLLMGVHTCEDLPREIGQAQDVLGTKLQLSCLAPLGLSPLLSPWLESCFQQYQTQPQAQRILLAHGSKRPGGHQAIANLAEKLAARAAYWKGGISLQETLAEFEKPGEVVILPYFLFTGGLTDLIKNQLEPLKLAYPHLHLQLGEPLGPHPVLAQLIAGEFQNV